MEKKSKVAVCEKCKGWVKACHVDYLNKVAEKEFTELSNEGFLVKTETIIKTQNRPYSTYTYCKLGNCLTPH